MTKARKAVLDILNASAGPLSALDIGKSAGLLCDTATVYRALHYLESEGYAESFVLSCTVHGTERYYMTHGVSHRHWFHCEVCHEFVDLGACRVEPLLKDMERSSGVSIRSHTLYATGVCARCIAGSGDAGSGIAGSGGAGLRPLSPAPARGS